MQWLLNTKKTLSNTFLTFIQSLSYNLAMGMGAIKKFHKEFFLVLGAPWNNKEFDSFTVDVLKSSDVLKSAFFGHKFFHWKEETCFLSVVDLVAKSYLALCNPLDRSPPRSSMGFSRHENWIGLLFPPLGDLPDPGIKPTSFAFPALAGRFLLLCHLGSPLV